MPQAETGPAAFDFQIQAVTLLPQLVSREPDPAAAFEEKWNAALIETAVEELRTLVSPVTYNALRLRLIEGRSEAETAAALNLTPEQVRYRKHRAQQKLRAILAVFAGESLDAAHAVGSDRPDQRHGH
jgi:DNA-directed RNA polymerase specialized sigma24 family protein